MATVFYIVMMLVGCSMYGLVSPVLRMAYDHGVGVNTVTDMQYILGAAVLWLAALFRHKGSTIRWKQWILIIGIAFTNACVTYTYYRSLTILPASVGIILLFQFAWIIVVIDIFIKRTAPSPLKWVGLALILLGTVLAVGLIRTDWQHVPAWAALLGLLSGLAYALNLYLAEYTDATVSPELRSALVVTIAMLFVFIAFPPGPLLHILFTPKVLYWGAWVSLFGQSLPTLLLVIAIPHIGGRMAGVLGTIELPMAVFGAWLLNHETIGWHRWLGVMLIIVGILISEWVLPKRKPKRRHSSETYA